jgi:hypothetical protein
MHGKHDDELIRRQQHSTGGDGTQVPGVAERLYNLFTGNERRHVKCFGPPVKSKSKKGEDKWKLDVKTHDGPATLALWQAHLSGEFILSIIPLLDDGKCWFAVLDADEYDLDYIEICHRIADNKFPLRPFVSKSCGLHLFVVFKEPVEAARVIPALRYMAQRLGLKDFEIFPSSAEVEAGGNTRAVAMPYGAQWDVLPEQSLLTGHGNRQLLEDCLFVIERARITADQLPEVPKTDGEDKTARKIPLYLQVAINSHGPYPNNDRSPVCASIIWQLAERGVSADEIQTMVENRGPFVRYNENNRSLKRDIKSILERYVTAHPDKGAAQAPPLPIQSSVEFVTNFVPPDYLIDGLLQRRFVYSMTGPTGEGKTSVALLIALHVARGLALDGREIDKGKVLFLAGENPDDVRMRWIKQLDYAGIDPKDVDVCFVPGSFAISDQTMRERIIQANGEHGPFDLIIVDTSVAFFEGDDENANIQMLAHAKMLRGLIKLISGNPTVIVTSHPVKNFTRENMLPRGGGAFLNEMDGNLTCMKIDGTMISELHWCGKFRGIDFNAIPFRLEVGKTEKLKDSKGRLLWTVIACQVTEGERNAAEDTAEKNKGKLLAMIVKMPGASMADLAQACEWFTKDGKPYKSLVQRLVNALKAEKMVRKENGKWVLTNKGRGQADLFG